MAQYLTTDAVVIGGGLAGSSVAFALGKRKITSTIIEQHSGLAQGASGNRYALLMPYLTAKPSSSETLYSVGFNFSRELLTRELSGAVDFTASGGLQLPATNRLKQLLEASYPLLSSCRIQRVSATEGTHISGLTVQHPSFYIPEAGYISPGTLVTALSSNSPGYSSLLTGTRVVAVVKTDGSWKTLLSNGLSVSSRLVIICGAYEASALDVCSWLPLEPIRGQTTLVRSSPASVKLRTILCYDGYITPADKANLEHLLGAHYRHGDTSIDVRQEDTNQIIQRCINWLPQAEIGFASPLASRVCFRTSTFDRLPYIGHLPEFTSMKEAARTFQPGTNVKRNIPLTLCDGAYVSLGHGSRGLLSCPLAGEIIARLIAGEDLGTLAAAAANTTPERAVFRQITHP